MTGILGGAVAIVALPIAAFCGWLLVYAAWLRVKRLRREGGK